MPAVRGRTQRFQAGSWKMGSGKASAVALIQNVSLRALQGDAVSILVGHRICDSQVAGSSSGWAPPRSGLRQATYTGSASVTSDALQLGR